MLFEGDPMNPIYLRLFDGYAADILQKADPFDSKSVDQLADISVAPV